VIEVNSAITMIVARVTTKVISTSRTVCTKRAATRILISAKRAKATADTREGLPAPNGMRMPRPPTASAAHDQASYRIAVVTPMPARRAK